MTCRLTLADIDAMLVTKPLAMSLAAITNLRTPKKDISVMVVLPPKKPII